MPCGIANVIVERKSLERTDNSGNYSPDNCIWATQRQQSLNKRCNHLITYRGETKTVMEWSEKLGINHNTLDYRLMRYQWDIEKAFTAPIKHFRDWMIEYHWETKPLSEWARYLNIPYNPLRKRLIRGWSVEKSFTEPLKVSRR